MKPFYHLAPQILDELATYYFSFLYWNWLRRNLRRKPVPYDIAHVLTGQATEIFKDAEAKGALKVLDCPNSHPTTLYGFWQRECDLWCPGERVPIPRWSFARMNREIEMADLIIVQSKFCKESMLLNGVPEEKVFVNPMGVDASVFRKRERVPEKPRFICVATISLRKGHPYLFRAFELVKRTLPEAELICVGDYKGDFRKEKPRWAGTFTHHPFLTHPQISKLLQTCTAFVFPSQEEGIARAQIEALACGLPVVGTHEAGTTTVVKDGVEGFIVHGRDPAQISKAMLQLAKDRSMNARMGDAAFNKASVGNTWQDYGDRLMAEYQRQLARKACVQSKPASGGFVKNRHIALSE